MTTAAKKKKMVERVQTGIRIEKQMLKVLKGLAEYLDISLTDLIESIVLHSLEGKQALTKPSTLKAVSELRKVYKLELTAADAHNLED